MARFEGRLALEAPVRLGPLYSVSTVKSQDPAPMQPMDLHGAPTLPQPNTITAVGYVEKGY